METERKLDSSRFPSNPIAAQGWTLDRLIGPSSLFGSNGMRIGPDGLLYVAQCFGNEITALDPAAGTRKTISSSGGPIEAPDDLAFDSKGTMFITEFLSARVSARRPNGEVQVIAVNVVGANGITTFRDRIFMDECRPEGHLMELFTDGRPPKLLAQGLAMPNALAVGPDERLYFPQLGAGEVCRIPLEGGKPEVLIAGLAAPTAVKFDNRGALLVTQAGIGEVSRVDIQNGQMTRFATLSVGLDNLVVTSDDRLFVSNFLDGRIVEVLANGSQRTVISPGVVWPSGLACTTEGLLYAADGAAILKVAAPGRTEVAGWFMAPGFPGFARGLAAGSGGMLYATTLAGDIAAWRPETSASEVWASGLSELYGVALCPGGSVIAAEGTGEVVEAAPGAELKVIARGLKHPTGVAVAPDGSRFVSETGAHRVVKIDGGVTPVLEGLDRPEGLAINGDDLVIVDTGSKQLWTVSMRVKKSAVIARELPVGCMPKSLIGVPGLLPGPIASFAGVATGPDGTIYVSGDAEGSIIALRRDRSAS